MMCENCYRRKATQADLYLNEWLCDDCYSKLDTINKTEEEIENIERHQIINRLF